MNPFRRIICTALLMLSFQCQSEDETRSICYTDPIPNAVCTEEYMPVCGCDTITYGNRCKADIAGVLEYTPGACSTVEVETAFRQWIASGITSYRFELYISCFCVYYEPFRIRVEDGIVVEVLGNGNISSAGLPLTIDALFLDIKQRLSANPDAARVEFDPDFGYPFLASFDMDFRIADEEISYQVNEFYID